MLFGGVFGNGVLKIGLVTRCVVVLTGRCAVLFRAGE